MTISFARPIGLSAVMLVSAVPTSSVADDAESKSHDCDGLKVEVFEPKDGVMEVRVDDLAVRISVGEGGSFNRAEYSVSMDEGNTQTSTSARKADEALHRACSLISRYYMNQKPADEELSKQLSELYDSL